MEAKEFWPIPCLLGKCFSYRFVLQSLFIGVLAGQVRSVDLPFSLAFMDE